MRERYEKLKHAAKEVLADLGYYRDGADFNKARYFPYPFLRYLIARDLYNCPGASLTNIGWVMGLDHSTVIWGLNKVNSLLTKDEAEIAKAYRKRVEEIDAGHVDKLWTVDDDHSILYLLIMQEKGRGLMTDESCCWYAENDDLAQYV